MGSEAQYLTVLGLSTAAAISLYFLVPFISGLSGTRPRGLVIPGLRNWANWCFCNSVLQSLASLPTLQDFLDVQVNESSKGHLKGQQNEGANDLHVEDESLMSMMRGMIALLNIEGPSRILSSAPLVSALERVQKTSISRAQQDAQEFLHILLESMAAELNRLPTSVSLQQMSALAAREGKRYTALPFEGALKTTNTCMSCHHQLKAQTSPFLELTLLPPPRNRMSLADCIAKTLESETIEDYHCIHCQIAALKKVGRDTRVYEDALKSDAEYELPSSAGKSHVTLRRTVELHHLPQILVLHINRSLFGGTYATRNAIDIEYDEVLTLTGTQHYVLCSLVTHKGSHDRGHYIAYRKKLGKWYAISDETVRLVNTETALGMGSATFLMFYEKVDSEAIEEKNGKTRLRQRKKKKAKRRKSANNGDEIQMDTVQSKI